MNQSQKAAHLDLSTRRLAEMFARGDLDRNADIDALRIAYIRRLRAVAGNRAPTGALDPSQERARLDKLRADQIADRIATERKELLRASDFEAELASAFGIVASSLEALPDILERDSGLDPAQVETVVRVVDRLRDDMARRLQSASA